MNSRPAIKHGHLANVLQLVLVLVVEMSDVSHFSWGTVLLKHFMLQ